MSIGRLAPAVAGLALIVGGIGCGSDEESSPTATTSTSTAAERPQPPEPTQPVSEQIPLFERAIAHPECEDAIAILHPIELEDPENPESKRNCEGAVGTLSAYDSFKASGSEEYGTGAIVDGVADGREVAMIWALDGDGRFKWISTEGIHHAIGTEPAPGDDFERPAVAFVEALRKGDCKAAAAAFATGGRLTYENEKTFCKFFEKNYMTAPAGFGARLKEDPAAELVELGTTRDWAFYGVATEPAGYRTLVVVGGIKGGAPGLWDVVPTER